MKDGDLLGRLLPPVIPELPALPHTQGGEKKTKYSSCHYCQGHRFYSGLKLAIFQPHHVLFSSLK